MVAHEARAACSHRLALPLARRRRCRRPDDNNSCGRVANREAAFSGVRRSRRGCSIASRSAGGPRTTIERECLPDVTHEEEVPTRAPVEEAG